MYAKNIHVKIPIELDDKFRKVIFKKMGLQKGDIRKCTIEAIEDWIEKNK